ncbi:hypothetical protein PoB_001292200 [Plakobranchus ocellatus]|uniref:Uncharacterized protein n=1 Tax=Plakobranchus ocellatus TaxID=259542 RepID=A0AAV3YTZ2_9GAST|nr:hypothetical protein PoB_001292200 [Plakobranchus ocellatus]
MQKETLGQPGNLSSWESQQCRHDKSGRRLQSPTSNAYKREGSRNCDRRSRRLKVQPSGVCFESTRNRDQVQYRVIIPNRYAFLPKFTETLRNFPKLTETHHRNSPKLN